jgi:serine/threonine protein kinase
MRSSGTSEETMRATPPIDIPAQNEEPALDAEGDDSLLEQYLRNRKPSVSFDDELKLDSGHRQSMAEPLRKPPKDRHRGRSLLQVLADERPQSRAHSESDRRMYDPVTGRYLPQYSESPPRELARVGEARFPILQSTVDAMARESQTHLPQPMSLTSDSTLSPTEEPRTPNDNEASPRYPGQAAFSYDEPRVFKRTASQRWRDSQSNGTSTDFFSRAGSLRNASGLSRAFSSPRLTRKDTGESTRSPRSAASSYLRAFSMSSSNEGEGDGTPSAVDAEGQTIGEDYVLGKQIGFGGFSTIREVTHMQGGRQRKLAVKIVRRQVTGRSDIENDQVQAEFEHEVELWRFLDHRHILPLEAVYKMDEATFCFIPLSTGGTLFDLVRMNRQGLPSDVAADYTRQIASALSYLHLDARVVHRDIKLENCLLDQDLRRPDGPGLVRLCDFGMAEWLSKDYLESMSGPPSPNINNVDRPPQKHIGPADSSTSAFAGGSLEYAAPEILRLSRALSSQHGDDKSGTAERAIVSPAVDIWALGVCVYSLVVGSRPFQNTFQPRVVMAILAGDWDLERLAVKGNDDIVECVKGCLDMEDSSRWDITRVLESNWLEGIVSDESDDERAWKL